MADTRAVDLIQKHEQRAAKRGTWESHWQDIADLVLPGDVTIRRHPGEKRREKIFDSTAPLAVQRFAAAVQSYVAPQGSKWHGLRAMPEELNEDEEVTEYFDALRDVLFTYRLAPFTNFYSQLNEVLLSLGAFGTGVLFIGEQPRGLRYKSVPIAEAYLGENAVGQIDQFDRFYEMSARQIRQMFKNVPSNVTRALDKEPDKPFQLLHCVMPREDYNERLKDSKNMPFASFYIERESRTILDEGGFRKFPYAVARYVTAPGEVYGRSPAMSVLPTIQGAGAIFKTMIRAAEYQAFPPTLVHEDGILGRMTLQPHSVVAGGLDAQGRAMVAPLQVGAQPQLGVDVLAQERGVINDAFLITLFQILVEAPQMTATEVLQRAQEKGALIGPALARLSTDLFGPLIDRELDLLAPHNALPKPPDVLVQYGGGYEVEYDSPLSRAQKSEEAVATMRLMEFAGANEPIYPGLTKRIDSDEALKIVHRSFGAPQKLLRTDDEMEALEEQEAQKMAAASALEAAPAAAGALKDIAQAGKLNADASAVRAGA